MASAEQMQALLEQVEQRAQAAAQAAAAAVGSYLALQNQREAQPPSWDKLVPIFDSREKDCRGAEWLCKAEDAFHLSMPDIDVSPRNKIFHISTKLKKENHLGSIAEDKSSFPYAPP